MKKLFYIAALVAVAGCAGPTSTIKFTGEKKTTDEVLRLVGGDWRPDAELRFYGRERVNYKFTPDMVISEPVNLKQMDYRHHRPEGAVKTVVYKPKRVVILLNFIVTIPGEPGWVKHAIAIELTAIKYTGAATQVFNFNPDKEKFPRALLESRINHGGELVRVSYYSETAFGNISITSVSEHGDLVGEIDLRFKRNMQNMLGHENQGHDIPDWREFPFKGEFSVPRYVKTRAKE